MQFRLNSSREITSYFATKATLKKELPKMRTAIYNLSK